VLAAAEQKTAQLIQAPAMPTPTEQFQALTEGKTYNPYTKEYMQVSQPQTQSLPVSSSPQIVSQTVTQASAPSIQSGLLVTGQSTIPMTQYGRTETFEEKTLVKTLGDDYLSAGLQVLYETSPIVSAAAIILPEATPQQKAGAVANLALWALPVVGTPAKALGATAVGFGTLGIVTNAGPALGGDKAAAVRVGASVIAIGAGAKSLRPSQAEMIEPLVLRRTTSEIAGELDMRTGDVNYIGRSGKTPFEGTTFPAKPLKVYTEIGGIQEARGTLFQEGGAITKPVTTKSGFVETTKFSIAEDFSRLGKEGSSSGTTLVTSYETKSVTVFGKRIQLPFGEKMETGMVLSRTRPIGEPAIVEIPGKNDFVIQIGKQATDYQFYGTDYVAGTVKSTSAIKMPTMGMGGGKSTVTNVPFSGSSVGGLDLFSGADIGAASVPKWASAFTPASSGLRISEGTDFIASPSSNVDMGLRTVPGQSTQLGTAQRTSLTPSMTQQLSQQTQTTQSTQQASSQMQALIQEPVQMVTPITVPVTTTTTSTTTSTSISPRPSTPFISTTFFPTSIAPPMIVGPRLYGGESNGKSRAVNAKRPYGYTPTLYGALSGKTLKRYPKIGAKEAVGIRYPVLKEKKVQVRRSAIDVLATGLINGNTQKQMGGIRKKWNTIGDTFARGLGLRRKRLI
jgi:hypothetical protein